MPTMHPALWMQLAGRAGAACREDLQGIPRRSMSSSTNFHPPFRSSCRPCLHVHRRTFQDSIAARSESLAEAPVPSVTCSSSSTPIFSLASCTGLQGRKRVTVLVRHRSFNLHRFIVLAPIRVVQVVLDSCRRALHSVLMFVMSYNYEFIV
jgi:hypothetical protein